VTLIEAAARLGLSPSTLRVQIHKGKLRSTKRGRDHWITEGEVERYRREHQATSSPSVSSAEPH
jgi:excisionase family DNA binding protein